jgi:hypothetical protein
MWPRKRRWTLSTVAPTFVTTSLKGAQTRFHATSLYSWMRPPSLSRRSIEAVGVWGA